MSLDPKGDLSAVELAFYSLALIVSTFVVFSLGFSRQQGWIFLVILSILRIVGAACILSLETQHTFSIGVYETAEITSSIGLAPLLLVLVGFLSRVNETRVTAEHGVSAIFFRVFQLASITALVLAIVGGTDEAGTEDTSSFDTGRKLREAASIIFLALYVCCIGLTAFFLSYLRVVASSERPLVYAALVALPFLGVRAIYSVLVAFDSGTPSSIFYFRDINVYAQAFMQFLMEAIVVVTFLAAGILTLRKIQSTQQHDTQAQSAGVELGSGKVHRAAGQQQGYQGLSQQPQQKSPLDYLPHRILFNSLRRR